MRVERLSGWALLLLLSTSSLEAAGSSSLITAVRAADARSIRALLQQGVDVNAPDVDGTTALHWAAYVDDASAAELLIRAGANVRAANRYGVTPISLAAMNGNPAIVEALLKGGADPNTVQTEGETVLMTAARAGAAGVVASLIAHGANVNVRDPWKGQTALMWAANEGHADVIRLLAARGAEVHARSTRGFTPLLFAAREGKIDSLRALLEAKANPNDQLPPEARANQKPAQPDARGRVPGGTSGLILAVMNAHYEAASLLVDAGADPNDDSLGYTVLHQITWARKPGGGANFPGPIGSGNMDGLTLVSRLVTAGANLNARVTKTPRNGPQAFQSFLNWIGTTPYLLAARGADAPLMRALADLGADTRLTNEDGSTALLICTGVGVRSPNEDPGSESEILEAVTLAIELGDDVNYKDKNGESPMHGAAVRGHNSLIQLLADKGANPEIWNQQNERGLRPVDMAAGYRRKNGSFQSNPHMVPLYKKLMGTAGDQTAGVQKHP